MKREIQAFGFFILCNAQTHDPVENFQDDEADNAGIDHGCANADKLHCQLIADTGDVTAETGTAQTFGAEHTG